jgi:hypothetical protein
MKHRKKHRNLRRHEVLPMLRTVSEAIVREAVRHVVD